MLSVMVKQRLRVSKNLCSINEWLNIRSGTCRTGVRGQGPCWVLRRIPAFPRRRAESHALSQPKRECMRVADVSLFRYFAPSWLVRVLTMCWRSFSVVIRHPLWDNVHSLGSTEATWEHPASRTIKSSSHSHTHCKSPTSLTSRIKRALV